jgi:hypothetical protein
MFSLQPEMIAVLLIGPLNLVVLILLFMQWRHRTKETKLLHSALEDLRLNSLVLEQLLSPTGQEGEPALSMELRWRHRTQQESVHSASPKEDDLALSLAGKSADTNSQTQQRQHNKDASINLGHSYFDDKLGGSKNRFDL